MKTENFLQFPKFFVMFMTILMLLFEPALSFAESDLNGDCVSDLADVVLALKVAAGLDAALKPIPSDEVMADVDVNGDKKIGTPEAVYLLEKLAENGPAYENNDAPEQANLLFVNNRCPQTHDFYESGDTDWVKFQVAIPGESYTIEIRNPEADCNAKIEIYDTDGQTPLNSVDGKGRGEEQVLEQIFEQEGTYFAKLTHAEADASGENTGYDLFVQTYEADNTFEQASLITLDEVQHHNFHVADDTDWMMFFAKADVHYSIEAGNVGSDCNVKIELYGTDGDTPRDAVDYNGKGKGETLIWRDCDQDGVYYIRVSHDDSDGVGENAGYDLELKISAAPWNFGAVLGFVYVLPYYSTGTIQGLTIKCRNDNFDSDVLYNEFLGIFYVYGLEEGDYTLTATAPGYPDTEITVQVDVRTVRRDIFMTPLFSPW